MSHKLMFVSSTNPNDTSGGGGCVCSPSKQTDCTGPYVVFPGNDMENILSPAVVLGAPCARAALEALGNEVLSAGEVTPIPGPLTIDDFDEDDLPEV